MSTVKSLFVGGQEYAVILSEGVIVGLKRYHPKHRLWVQLYFADVETGAEATLLAMLESAYVENQVSLVSI